MGFDQPKGRIVRNTGTGPPIRVNPEKLTFYGFIGDDRVQECVLGDGNTVTINRFEEIRIELSKMEV